MRCLVRGGQTVFDNEKQKQAKMQIRTQHTDLSGYLDISLIPD